jgi:hypothetical protein
MSLYLPPFSIKATESSESIRDGGENRANKREEVWKE